MLEERAALPPDTPLTGQTLRETRCAAGLSRRALAEVCGLHTDTIRYWEGKARVDLRGHAPGIILVALGLGHLSQRGLYPAELLAASRIGDFSRTTRARDGVLPAFSPSPSKGPCVRCAALTRKGTPCRAKALPGKTRCKFHGGASTGPRTAEGRARIAEAQRKRWADWRAARCGWQGVSEPFKASESGPMQGHIFACPRNREPQ